MSGSSRAGRRRLASALLSLAAAVLSLLFVTAPARADEQVLAAVTPGNGDFVATVPDEVVLTFAEPLDGTTVSVTLRAPSGEMPVTPQVRDRQASVPVPPGGPGEYVVEYVVTPGDSRGQTGFTVLAAGESAPAAEPRSAWWMVGGALLLVGVGVVLSRIALLWRRR
jgi:methionine-rich copper-binding protein CopC